MKRIYSNLKTFRYPDRLAALARGELPAPVQVRIKPINACNHHCWFCAYRADNLDLGSQMSLRDRIPPKKMGEIVDDLVSMRVAAVTFSGGGEPLLYPGIELIVEALALGGVRVATLTNGSRLQGKVAEAFARHGTWVRVSMDAWDGPSCARARGIKESDFEAILGNMREFAASGTRCWLGVSFIVTKENAGHLFEACQLLRSIGVKQVKLSACVVGNGPAENDEYHAAIEPLVRAQIEKARGLENGSFSIVNHYHGTTERFVKSYHRCPMLGFLIVIGADCKVYTCQDKAYTESGCLGSIRERSFGEFWRSEEARQAVARIDPAAHCQHHCVSHSKNLLLDEFLSLDPEHGCFV